MPSAAASLSQGMLPPPDLQPLFEQASSTYGVPINVLAALAQQESSYRADAVGVDTKWGKAKGLMQYIDPTAKGMGINAMDAAQSIDAAAKQFKDRLDKGYTVQEAIAAHHGGDDRAQWGPKTAKYVQDVMGKAGTIDQEMTAGKILSEAQNQQDIPGLQAQADAEEPGRYKVMTEADAAHYIKRQELASGKGALENAKNAIGGYDAPSPLTIPIQQRAEELVNGQQPPSPLTVTNQARAKAGLGPRDDLPPDDFMAATSKSLQNWGPHMRNAVGGLIRSYGEQVDDQTLVSNAQNAGIIDRMKDSGALTMIQDERGNFTPTLPDGKPADVSAMAAYIRQNAPDLMTPDEAGTMLGMKPSEVSAYGRKMSKEARRDELKVNPDGPLAKYGSMIIGSTAEMAPAILTGMVTRNPKLALSMIGGQVYGQSYNEARGKLNPQDAATYAILQAAAEAIPEALPLHYILKPGVNIFKGMLKAGTAEALQEEFTQLIQTGLDKGSINPKMTWEEARQQLIDAPIVGFGSGAAMHGGIHGAQKGAEALKSKDRRLGEALNQEIDNTDISGGTSEEAVRRLDPNNYQGEQTGPGEQVWEPGNKPAPGPVGSLAHAASLATQSQDAQRVTVQTPTGPVTGTLESYQPGQKDSWEARVLSDDGQYYHYTDKDGVTITPEGPAPGETPMASEPAPLPDEEPMASDTLSPFERNQLRAAGYDDDQLGAMTAEEGQQALWQMELDGSHIPTLTDKVDIPTLTDRVDGPIPTLTDVVKKGVDIPTLTDVVKPGPIPTLTDVVKKGVEIPTLHDEVEVPTLTDVVKKGVEIPTLTEEVPTLKNVVAPPGTPDYTAMDFPQLRAALKETAAEIKAAPKNASLQVKRKAIEKAILAKSKEVAKPAEPAKAEEPPAKAEEPVANVAKAAKTEEATKPVKWFGSRAKAEGYIFAKDMRDTHEVVDVGKSRFEVREIGQAEPVEAEPAGKPDSRAERRKLPSEVEGELHTALHTLNMAEERLKRAFRARGKDDPVVQALVEALRPGIAKARETLRKVERSAVESGADYNKVLAETDGVPDLSAYGLDDSPAEATPKAKPAEAAPAVEKAAAKTPQQKAKVLKAKRQEETRVTLGVKEGEKFTMSADVGYATAGRTYTLDTIGSDGVAYVSGEGGSTTNLSRADLISAVNKGVTFSKIGEASNTEAEKPKAPVSTAPEHAHVGVDDRELGEIVAEFDAALEDSQDADDQVHHLFDAPAKNEVVRLKDKAMVYQKEHGWMTLDEAKAQIAEWKAHAAAQYDNQDSRIANNDKVVLSFFDLTGKWSQPWEDAGYQVYRFDIQDDPDMGDVHNFSTEFFNDWFGNFDGQDIYAILAACPCTDFAVSGARHFAAKDADGRTVASVKLVHQTLAAIEYFKPSIWAIENPVGRIEKLGSLPPWRLSFDPYHLGEPYTKKTLIWGRFNADLPVAPVEPTEGSKMHSQYGGKSIATKNARSATPEGFSYGFFMANNAIDNPVMAISNKYDRLDPDAIAGAVDAGMTEQDIDEVVEDFYYQDLDDEAANEALREATAERTDEDVEDAEVVEPEPEPKQKYPSNVNYTPNDYSAVTSVIDLMNGDIDKPTLIERLSKLDLGEAQVNSFTMRLNGSPNEFTSADITRVVEGPPKAKAPDAKPKTEKAPAPAPKPAEYGANNTLVSSTRADELRAQLKAKFNGSQLNSGLDPVILSLGTELAVYHLEAGVRKFATFAKTMADDLGQPLAKIRPYLRSWYNGGRDLMEDSGVSIEGMDDPTVVRAELAKLDAPAPEAKKPSAPTKKAGTKGDMVLTQDWGVEHIDGYGDGTREIGNATKDAYLKEARTYLNAVADALRSYGYEPHLDRKDKPEKPVSVNEAGPAVSGDVSLIMRNEATGNNVYITIGDSALGGMFPATRSGIAIMYRVGQSSDRYVKGAMNTWAPVDLTADALAALVNGRARPQQQKVDKEASPDDISTAKADGSANADGQQPGASQADGASGDTGSVGKQPDGGLRGERGERPADGAKPTSGKSRPGQTELPVSDDSRSGPATGARADQRNYRIQPGELKRTGSWKATAEQNVKIVELVKQILSENRQATPEEKALLTKFTGWGASEIANGVFPDKYGRYKDPSWQALGERLKAAMTPEEYAQARRSTQYAHYTSEPIIRSVYAALDRLGFNGGQVLEPGMGIGLFNGLMPDAIASNSSYTGVEYDTFTGNIGKLLYPQSNVLIGDYAQTKLPRDFFDAAIGNPPFSQTKVQGDPEYRKQAFLLHDYFFAKTIDRVKPGGLLVFVTSKGTMDKASDRARKYLMERADLVGAIRLPQTAFKDNAGTEVVTDVIFLRKRDTDELPLGKEWGGLAEVPTAQGPAMVNQYFAAHPEMVLGRHAKTGSMYRADEYTVEPIEGGDIEQQFAKAIENLPENIYRPPQGSPAEAAAVQRRDYDPKIKKEGGVYVADDGTLMQVSSGQGTPLVNRMGSNGQDIDLKPREVEWLKGWAGVRDALKQAQYDQLNDGPWEKSLKALNKTYDAFTKTHGPLMSHTISERESENEDGTVTTTVMRRFKNDPLIRLDVEGPLASALENYDTEGNISKAPVLLGRTINKPSAPTITSTQDAMFVSLNDLGRFDLAHVAKLAGKTEAEAIDELGTAIYQDPSAGWTTADDYLSGNVRRKLHEAEAAARLNKDYARNVEPLKNVQPRALAPQDITVQLGSAWVPPTDIENFAAEVMGEKYSIRYLPKAAQWTVDGASSRVSEWGTGDKKSGDILEGVLNNRQMKVTYKDAEGKTHTDAEGTEKVNDIAKKLRAEFKRWIWKDKHRADRLATYYNENYNNIAPREFDGSHLTLPGVSARFNLRPHQKRGIWRTIQQGDTYYAHAVGAGKTFTMIAAGMEERRLGLSKKPMYVVPNHMLAQFSKEFLELYPTAQIMVADEQNFHTNNRRKFVAQAALNDPDAIVITHSAFGRIGMSPEFSQRFITEQIDDWKAALDEADKSDRVTVKHIEAAIERLENRLKKIIAGEDKDKVLNFEDLGVDRLFVDEGHEFRKLDFPTNRGSVKGITSKGSQRAMDLYMKVSHLREKNPGRALVMASGTPVTNTMGELFTVQRFFQPEQLEEDGDGTFDAWANHYGEVVDGLEQNAAGGYESVARFAKFINVPELMSRVRSFMDILTSNQLGDLVVRPDVEGGGRNIMVTPTPDGYKAYQKDLENRIKAIRARKGPPKAGDDIILSVISDGRFSAIDMRFVDPKLPSDPNSKLNVVIDNMIKAYHDTASNQYSSNGKVDELPGASQMLFVDIGLGEQSAENRGFDMKAWIKRRLIEGGVKADHIAFMRDNKAHSKKERLFDDLRSGRKRILIGGKDMETGVNAQKRLSHLHHLDAPWFPASVEQREGRIIRQGNQNLNVNINAYASKGSYDSTMWGMNARKARFIEQAMTGDTSLRSMDDVSEASAFEMAAALASGDERYLQLAGLKGDVERLNRLYSAHIDDQRRLRTEKMGTESTLKHNTQQVKALQDAIDKREPIKAGEFAGKVGKTTYDKRDEFSVALHNEFKALAESYTPGEQVLGSIGGFPILYNGVELRGGNFAADASIDVAGNPDPLIVFPIEPNAAINGIATRAANQVNGLEYQMSRRKEQMAEAEDKLKKIDRRLGAAFPEMSELAEKREQLQDLESELEAESKANAAAESAGAPVPGSEIAGAVNPAAKMSVREDLPATPESTGVREAITRGEFGPQVRKLIDAGQVVIHDTEKTLPASAGKVSGIQAVTTPDGVVHLVASNLTPATAPGVLLHEMFHSGAKSLLGTPRWNAMMNRLDALLRQAKQSTGKARNVYDRAAERVAKAQARGAVPADLTAEEFGAYAIEEYEKLPAAFKKWADDVVGMLKHWLLNRFGLQAGRVTPGQLRALAVDALRSKVAEQTHEDSVIPDPRYSVLSDNTALADATAALTAPKQIKPDAIGQLSDDIGRVAKFVLHPRQIASLHKPFTPVYNTAIQQFEMRDALIDELQRDHKAYDLLPQASKAKVNAVLELGRLYNATYHDKALKAGIAHTGTKTVVKKDEDGKPYRVQEPVQALLSVRGEVHKLNDAEIEAYLGLRDMFDNALDKFRDQTLTDFGFPELAGMKNPSEALKAMITPDMSPLKQTRIEGVARFIGEIEQAKRGGYVPFARYGDYVVAVKEQELPLNLIKDTFNGGWITRDLPKAYHQFLEDLGAKYDNSEEGYRLDEAQRKALIGENEKTVHSTKVEFTLKDKALIKAGRPVQELPSVKKALADAEKMKEGKPNRRVVAFEAIQKQPDGGVKLADVDALAEVAMLDTDTWDAVREQLGDAIKGRSFRKHFFQSDNVPGYTGDFERAIADYMAGMSGYLARRHYNNAWDNALTKVKAPRLFDYASKYRAYVNEPHEELAMLRQVGFLSYIAGVPATAFANLTQPLLLTLPVLGQIAPQHLVMREMARAYKDALAMARVNKKTGLDFFDPDAAPADLKGTLREAWAEGMFVPLQTYEVMATARTGNAKGRKLARRFNKVVEATAALFSFAERLNRLVTFMTAARLSQRPAVKANMQKVYGKNPLAKAMMRNWSAKALGEFMIDETQFRMGKANRPVVSRGVGSALMQFKGFMMQSLETWFRLATQNGKQGVKAAALSIGLMALLGGLWGMPGADDLRDIIEKVYKQITKQDLDLKTELRQALYELTGQRWIGEVASKGATYPFGLDLSRIGMGNIAPDSPLQMFGIPADLFIGRGGRAFEKGSHGDLLGAAGEFLPNFLKNPITAYGWSQGGVRDSAGRMSIGADQIGAGEVASKALGFQPTQITNVRDYEYAQRRMETANDKLKADYVARIAKAIATAEKHPDKAAEAQAELAEINQELEERNANATPENQILLGRTAIKNRIQREMGGVGETWGHERKQARGASEQMRKAFGLSKPE
jgi:N12 class adenine-specific DNA methylase